MRNHHRQGVKGQSNCLKLKLIAVLALFSGFQYSKHLLAVNSRPPDDNWEEASARPPPTQAKRLSKTPRHPHHQHHRHRHQNSFSFCLLLKDDNEILNEWLAYHYHIINLRHLIVAIDPSSLTSPSHIFQEWRQVFGLEVEEWTDSDYMPDFFLQGQYDQIPVDFLHVKNRTHNVWHSSAGITDIQVIEKELQAINNHRFRQVFFLHKCAQSIRNRHSQQQQQQRLASFRERHDSQNKSISNSTTTPAPTPTPEEENTTSSYAWMAHIDTDEYIVVNPQIRAQKPDFLKNILPSGPHPSSLLNFLEDYLHSNPQNLNRTCIAMGMVRFGAMEEDGPTYNRNSTTILHANDTKGGWNRSHFETFRWRYFGSANSTVNQKNVINVARIPHDDKLLHECAYSIHRPSRDCPKFPAHHRALVLDTIHQYPLAVNHYLGSYQRYSSRTDVRRNTVLYRRHANVSDGGQDDDWLSGWLDSFIQTNGHERVARVLKDYLV